MARRDGVGMKRLLLYLVLILVGGLGVDCSDAQSDGGGRASASDAPTSERKLATIETGRDVAEDDPLVRSFAAALDELQRLCRADNRERIADQAVVAQRLLKNGGVTESLLSILTHVRKSIPEESKQQLNLACSDAFGAYVVLRGGKPD